MRLTLALSPFWNTQSTFWASSATKDTSSLGYTYPDFNGLNTGDPNAVQTAIANRVNQLYGSSVFGLQSAFVAPTLASGTPAVKPAPATVVKPAPAPVVKPASAPEVKPTPTPAPAVKPTPAPAPAHVAAPAAAHAPAPAHVAAPAQQIPVAVPVSGSHSKPLYDWTCRIEFKKHELSASFSVLIFLGGVPEEPQQWRRSPNYVGGHYAFVNSNAEECENCRSQGDVVVEGFVHLNSAIIKKNGPDLSPRVVEHYLKHHLKWRVQKVRCYSMS